MKSVTFWVVNPYNLMKVPEYAAKEAGIAKMLQSLNPVYCPVRSGVSTCVRARNPVQLWDIRQSKRREHRIWRILIDKIRYQETPSEINLRNLGM
jgi:hypothetical protein